MTRILVTGGSGFIGANLVAALVARGETVRVLDNSFRGARANLGALADSVEMIEGDIRDAGTVRRAAGGVDTVFHLAAINGTAHFYDSPGLVLEVAIRGQLNIIDAAVEQGVGTLMFASSSEAYQTPPAVPTAERVPLVVPDLDNPRYSYGGGKIAGELLLRHYAAIPRRIIFRPHNVYGPAMGHEHVIPQLARRIWQASDRGRRSRAHIVIQGTGAETRAFCHVDDAIAGILLAHDKGNDAEVFNVGVEQETTIADLAMAVGRAMGVAVTIEAGTAPAGATPRRCPDMARLRALGYRPGVSLEAGLVKTVAWYCRQFAAESA